MVVQSALDAGAQGEDVGGARLAPSHSAEQRQLRPVEKPRTVRRLGAVDIAALAEQVARLSEAVWEKENAVKENDFFCFAHTRHIIFRFVAAQTLGCFYSMPIWHLWQRWLLPVMRQAAAPYGYATPLFPKAMLARLDAGYGIEPHQDCGGMNPLTHKIHVPLETGPQATLTVRGQTLHLPAGQAFEVNNLAPHSALNGEPRDRVHLIFEVFEGAGMEWRERRSRRTAMGCLGSDLMPDHLA